MTALEAQWTPAKHLILGDDPQLRVYGEAAVWLKKIELFRKGEDERMFLQEPGPGDLAVHKTLLQRLVTDGDHLLALADQIGFPDNVEGITSESIAATVELLRADYRGWHDPVAEGKRREILRQVFPNVALTR